MMDGIGLRRWTEYKGLFYVHNNSYNVGSKCFGRFRQVGRFKGARIKEVPLYLFSGRASQFCMCMSERTGMVRCSVIEVRLITKEQR